MSPVRSARSRSIWCSIRSASPSATASSFSWSAWELRRWEFCNSATSRNDDRRDCVDHELPRIHVGEHEADNDAVERGPIRDMHKVVKLARQPGGLKTLTDVELSAYVSWLRDGADDRSRDKKARKGFQQSLGEAEAEAARRNL